MLWILVIVAAYLLLAVSTLVDRYLLLGPPNPKTYAFYVSFPGIFLLTLLPFVNFVVPDPETFIFSLIGGAAGVFALFFFYKAIEKYEVSKVAPAVGGLTPLSVLLASFLIFGVQSLGWQEILAFSFLVSGSILISLERQEKISLRGFGLYFVVALLFALSTVILKYVYSQVGFWSGLIFSRVGAFLAALLFLCENSLRQEISGKTSSFKKTTGFVFVLNQILGALAGFLQSLAIALVPISFLAFISALDGLRYVFILTFSVLFSVKFPRFFKERISRNAVLHKSFAIFLIIAGLIWLGFRNPF